MEIQGLKLLPEVITKNDEGDLTQAFKRVFGSIEAKEASGIVYFFFSEKPFPRLNGRTNIIYIGKSDNSLYERYYRVSNKLGSGRNKTIYKYILENFGDISIGYVFTEEPKKTEKEYFKKYLDKYFEYPPKSKAG